MKSALKTIIISLLTLFAINAGMAQTAFPTQAAQPFIIPNPPNINAQAYILMDEQSGKILAQKNMDVKRPPASLTKLMTLYLTFQALKTGAIKLDSKVRISKKAWKMGGSKMFVRVGTDATVDQLIQGVIVDSGNDACVALAEYVAGSESSFVNMMNQQAKLLGMKNTHYTDCTGMPHPDHYVTTKSLAILVRAIIQNFPQYYHYFSQKWFAYNNIRQPNRNRLLWRYPGTDGLKTGHTKQAGFCLVASAIKNGMRLISIVMGTPTDEARSDDSIRLLTYGFRFFNSHLIYQANTAVATPRVWFGEKKSVSAGVLQDLYIIAPRGEFQHIKVITNTNHNLKAPIKKGDPVGTITITNNGKPLEVVPLVALNEVKGGGMWRRMFDHVAHVFHGWFSSKEKPKIKTITKTAKMPVVPTGAPTNTQTNNVAPTTNPQTTNSAQATPTAPQMQQPQTQNQQQPTTNAAPPAQQLPATEKSILQPANVKNHS